MKLVTFSRSVDGSQAIGILSDDGRHVIDLQKAEEAMSNKNPWFFKDMIAFLSGESEARDMALSVREYAESRMLPSAVLPVETTALLAPVPRPESVRDCMAFEDHIINCIRQVGLKKFGVADAWIEKTFGRKWSLAYRLNKTFYERPVYYKSNRFSVVGPDADVVIPAYTSKMDYELEFGVFICKQGRDIPLNRAGDYIGGFTVFNDFSARDIQLSEQKGRLGPAKGKDFDTGNAMGPVLVTPDEIGDPYDLEMTASVNGEVWSKGNSGDMHWQFEEIISYISRNETLYPGEFIGSGTCSGSLGCGCGLEMGKFLQRGDRVELQVEKIGVLRNRVV